ncbi:MAG: hypothetical protein AAF961_17100, partial [Planctomycetota bacterium]
MNLRRSPLLILSLYAGLRAIHPVVGEEPSVTAAAADEATVSAEVAERASPTVRDVASATVEEIRQQAHEDDQLTAETRAEITDLCDKIVAVRTETEALVGDTAALEKELEEVRTEQPESALPKEAQPSPLPSEIDPAEKIRSLLSAADQRVSAARERAEQIAADIERRAERRKVLPEALAKCREKLSQAEEGLETPPSAEQPLLSEARRLYQICRRDYFKKQLQWLEQESRTYEATSRWKLAKRDAAEKALQSAIDTHKAALDIAAKVQRREAEQRASEARRAAVTAHPAVKEAAAMNSEFAERNRELVSRAQRVQDRLAVVRELAQTMQNRREDVAKRAAAAWNTPAIGMMLRS